MFTRLLALFLLTATLVTSAQATAPPAAPLMETINGEKPIELQSLRIASDISGGMAETTVRMVFFNPNPRTLEGNLQFPLLAGQQITQFSLDINGELRPAVVVEKAKGRKIFEEIERRIVDPALLENTQGNNFKLRVYPIGAMQTRTVELKYAEALVREGAHWAYRLPLAYGERMQDFDLALNVHGIRGEPIASGALGKINFSRLADGYQAHVEKSRFAPSGTLKLLLPASAQAQTYIQERDGASYFVAEIPVSTQRTQRVLPKVVGLLWDSSGSGAARDISREIFELNRYFQALDNAQVRLTRLRDRSEAVESFNIVNGNWDALRSDLQSTIYDGASALAQWQPQADVGEYLLVSDGLLNYGSTEFAQLLPGQHLYALSSSLVADTSRLAALAQRSGGQLAQVLPEQPGAAANALLTESAHLSSINALGATDVLLDSADPQQGLLRVAGKLSAPMAQLKLRVVEQGKARDVNLAISVNAPRHALAAHLWANYKLRVLDADFEAHRAEIRRVGTQFGIATRETSLIVLDRLEDYVRYDLTPPRSLLPAFATLKDFKATQITLKRQNHLDTAVRDFEQKIAWWEKTYPKDELPKPKLQAKTASLGASFPSADASMAAMAAPPRPMAAPAPVPSPSPVAVSSSRTDGGAPQRMTAASKESAPAQIGIALKKWTSDAPYMTRMKAASANTIYAVYLDEKPSYANSSGFFLDAADVLLDKGQRDLALRVLSNLAEMDLENRHVLRLLGYRLMQAGAPELAISVFEKVVLIAQEEPQSFRDLGLALAAAGHHQRAIDQLNEVLSRPWDGRFAEIELIALAELNAMVATAPGPLDTSRIDRRLLRNLPLDLRAVLSWDADNSDMDLHVIDPNGERCYYSHRFTYQGGRLSRDFTGGYGPEEFSLRDAKPGKYKIEVNFYGSRQQALAGPVTLQVKLTTGFGTPQSKEQTIALRLKGQGQTEYVGEFEVPAKSQAPVTSPTSSTHLSPSPL